MESKLLVVILAVALLLSLFLVSGAGCQMQETGTEVSAEELDSELNDLEEMGQTLNDLEMDMNESELEDLEGIL